MQTFDQPDDTYRFDDAETFSYRGREFRVRLPYDEHADPPWAQSDGHGPVSGWEPYRHNESGKSPGQVVLCRDRHHARFYDMRAAVQLARKEHWGWGRPDDPDSSAAWKAQGKTPGQIAAEAARRDFEFLRRWCDNVWHYIGVQVQLLGSLITQMDGERHETSIWGIEDDDPRYVSQTVFELADELLHEERTFDQRWAPCPHCNGSGKVARPQPVPLPLEAAGDPS